MNFDQEIFKKNLVRYEILLQFPRHELKIKFQKNRSKSCALQKYWQIPGSKLDASFGSNLLYFTLFILF